MSKDYYSILGLDKDAAPAEIKAAYRKLAHKFHPDKNPGDPFFDKMFRDVKEAYEALNQEITETHSRSSHSSNNGETDNNYEKKKDASSTSGSKKSSLTNLISKFRNLKTFEIEENEGLALGLISVLAFFSTTFDIVRPVTHIIIFLLSVILVVLQFRLKEYFELVFYICLIVVYNPFFDLVNTFMPFSWNWSLINGLVLFMTIGLSRKN
ncbi:MAG: DnaJ domain-containing protein [Imperialibacter sp.]|uniref:J domain-containing protein n=1 Tax=Imperialibacter sp. TaxID=2038411 RepID=UPI0032EAA72F